jgi:cold shock CspA family protein
MDGTVVLASKRGFYFIADDESGEQYFLHASAVKDRIFLNSGDKVRFELEQHPQGRNKVRAVNAVRIAAAVVEKDTHHEISIQQ